MGTLPIASGGTGATTFTNNRLLTGNGTSAIVDEANLTFDGTTLGVTGQVSNNLTGSYNTAQSFVNQTGTVTSTGNSLTFSGIRSGATFSNDGTPTNNNYYAGNFNSSASGSTAAAAVVGLTGSATNSSPNVADLIGLKYTATESNNTTNLSDRLGGDFTAQFTGAADHHTGYGFRSTLTTTSTGRWNTGFGALLQAYNAVSLFGADVLAYSNIGTGNSQRGIRIQNNVSGAGVVVDNVYGIELRSAATSSGVITNYYGIYQNSVPSGATLTYFLYGTQASAKSYLAGQLGLGITSPNAAAKLQMDSTTQGFLPPRMTLAQRDAISTPPEGLQVHNTTTKGIDYYSGTRWIRTSQTTGTPTATAATGYSAASATGNDLSGYVTFTSAGSATTGKVMDFDFSSAFPTSSTYAVILSPKDTDSASNPVVQCFYITNVAVTGFDIEWNNSIISTLSGGGVTYIPAGTYEFYYNIVQTS